MGTSLFARSAPGLVAKYLTGTMQGEDKRKAEERQNQMDAFAEYARRRQLALQQEQMGNLDEYRQGQLQNAQAQNALKEEMGRRDRDLRDLIAQKGSWAQQAQLGPNGTVLKGQQNQKDIATEQNATGITKEQIRAAARMGAAQASANRPVRVPASAQAYIRERQSGLEQIQRAREAVKAHPQAFGIKNFLPGQMGRNMVNENIDPQGVAARSAVGLLGGQQLHNLGGSNLTAAERQLYEPGIPSLTNNASTILEKLNQLESQYNNDILNAKAQYGIEDVPSGQPGGEVDTETAAWLKQHRKGRKP